MTIVRYLCRPTLIRRQLVIHLFCFKLYNQVRRSYDELIYWPASVGQAARRRARTKLSEFPKLWRPFYWQATFSDLIMAYALLKYATPSLLPTLVELLIRRPANLAMEAHCYVPGRFVFHSGLYRLLALLHVFANISYRYSLKWLNKSYDLSLVWFLVQRDQSIKEYCQNVVARQYQDYTTDGRLTLLRSHQVSPASSSGPLVRRQNGGCFQQQHQGDHLVVPLDSSPADDLWRFHCFMSYRVERKLARISKGLTRDQTSATSGHGASAGKTVTIGEYKLRPNRTVGALAGLRKYIARLTILMSLAQGFMCLTVGPAIVAAVLLDSHHALVYPGCERLVEINSGLSSLSITLTRYRILTGLVDLIESLTIWFDSGVGITFVFIMPCLLVHDLLVYWRSWHSRLAAILSEARRNFDQIYNLERLQRKRNYHGGGGNVRGLNAGMQCASRLISQAAAATGNNCKLAASIEEIRLEMIDFFQEFAKVETAMSHILTVALIYWFVGILGVGFGLVNLYSQGKNILGLDLIHICGPILVCFSAPITIVCGHTLRLFLNCNKSYKLLFSLMVHVHPRQKLRLLSVAEFFIDDKRHTFKFLNGYIFTPSSSLTLISLTVSCVALVFSILN